MIRKVLDFWFPSPLKLLITAPLAQVNTSAFALWFGANPDTDKSIRDSFLSDLISLANSSKLQHEMLESIEGAMAMLIIFDQFTRNIFRNTPEAFMYDSLALKTAQFICEKKWDLQMNPIYRGFAYLPFEHSEEISHQDTSVELYRKLCSDISQSPELNQLYGQFCNQFLNYATLHRDIIVKFNRFPHRNFVLGRQSTPDEISYLESGAETFGVTKTK